MNIRTQLNNNEQFCYHGKNSLVWTGIATQVIQQEVYIVLTFFVWKSLTTLARLTNQVKYTSDPTIKCTFFSFLFLCIEPHCSVSLFVRQHSGLPAMSSERNPFTVTSKTVEDLVDRGYLQQKSAISGTLNRPLWFKVYRLRQIKTLNKSLRAGSAPPAFNLHQ